jgi:hypothetical protein
MATRQRRRAQILREEGERAAPGEIADGLVARVVEMQPCYWHLPDLDERRNPPKWSRR